MTAADFGSTDMARPQLLMAITSLGPVVLMIIAMIAAKFGRTTTPQLWRQFIGLSAVALLLGSIAVLGHWALDIPKPGAAETTLLPGLAVSSLGIWLASGVQFLGTIIGAFSSRYLQGEPGQPRYISALSGVLAAVHVILLANHWLVLIAAWAIVGGLLQQLLCFYPDRPFALLAAHKKRIADRLADILLLSAAALAWSVVGSGSFTVLWHYLASENISIALQVSAVCLVLAVILRTALLPVHGWLIQVMEAPTPVSALLHAGVVNLGGFVLIRFAPLLEAAPFARWILITFGLGTALFAGLVMLTRISIKVRLAWSTVAQMGFMLLECGLGLYTLAAMHLIGHSLYKAHAFLSASSIVQSSKLQIMRGVAVPSLPSLIIAPWFALLTLLVVQWFLSAGTWAWWWNGVLAFAWAPLLWIPAQRRQAWWRVFAGLSMVAGLAAALLLAHALPLGLLDRPDQIAGIVTLLGMGMIYLCLMLLQIRAHALSGLRRWSYAGFYLDEWFTRLTLRFWPPQSTEPTLCSDDDSSARPVPRISSH